MNKAKADKKWLRRNLGSLQAFIGIGGVAGGIGLVSDPSGGNMGWSTEILAASPFGDFLVPGLVLLAINGIGSLFGTFLTFSRRPFAAEVAVGLGGFLVAWIVIQVHLIGLVHWLQPLFFVLGLLEFALGLLARLPARRLR